FLGHDVLRLALGADEEDRLSVCGKIGDELFGVPELLHRLVEIDDVNAVSLPEDVFLHLRIPALRLVAEMHAGLQQILHCNPGQMSSLSRAGLKTRLYNYRLLNW